MMNLSRSEELIRQAYEADDNGEEVYIQYIEGTEIVKCIEVSGREYLNDESKDEMDDLYWSADADRVAERYWRS